MTTLKEAFKMVDEKTPSITDPERVALHQACGRILARDVKADLDQPPFNKSAMDGYACKMEDLPGPLKITHTLAAGDLSTDALQHGHCVQIFTGARVPNGADCVVMQEYTLINENGDLVVTASQNKSNICLRGEDVHLGQVIAHAKTTLAPPDLSILASAGEIEPYVFRKPIVGVICTGNEIIDAYMRPDGAKIRNTNIYQLQSQIEKQGGIARYYGIVPDEPKQLLACCSNALAECDMLITTGGASVGAYDLIPTIFNDLGATIHFSGVSMQPGSPVIFATLGNKVLWGLSGNPVSSYLQFLLLTSHSITRLGGGNTKSLRPLHRLADIIVRHKKNRELFVPVSLTAEGTIDPVSFNGSAHLAALGGIYGFACVPAECNRIEKGELIECIVI